MRMINSLMKNSRDLGERTILGTVKTLLSAALFAAASVTFAVPNAHAAPRDIEQAEKLIWGSDGQLDPENGKLILEKAAAEGDWVAKRVLGLHLIFGWVLNQDVAAGMKMLDEAADAGDAAAQTALASIYLWGLAGETNLEAARKNLEGASKLGDPEAMRILGEQLVLGEKFEQDLDVGLSYLKQGISLNDPKSAVTLGELYLFGRGVPRDRSKAREAVETAATLGDGHGLVKYGEDTMWREINATAAEKMLLRAADMGATEAYAILAEGAMYGYLGGGSVSRRKYAGYAEKATEAEDGRVPLLEAERSMWGIGKRASGPAALAGLTLAADKGNELAAMYLIALQRDGNRYNVRRSISDAQDSLEKYGHLLSDKQKAQYAMTIDASKARTPAAYAPVAEAFEERTELRSVWFGREIFKANPNVAFYILQKRLKAQGLYAGALNGYATRQTLRAVFKSCMAELDRSLCNDNVMRREVIGGLLALD